MRKRLKKASFFYYTKVTMKFQIKKWSELVNFYENSGN